MCGIVPDSTPEMQAQACQWMKVNYVRNHWRWQ